MRCWAVLFGTWIAAMAGAQPLERSISPSRQFIIFGGETPLRGAVSDAAESVKQTWLTLLHEPDHWKTPIVIYLQFEQANVPELPRTKLNVSQTGAGLKLQLDLLMTRDMNPEEIRRALLRAIVLERMYRGHVDLPAGAPYVSPPDWLIEALLLATPGTSRDMFAGLTIPANSLDQFVRQSPELLDSPARRIYRGSALALLQLMLETPGRLARYVTSLPDSSNDPLADIVTQFGSYSANDIERMWREALARLSSGQPRFLTFPETEKRLAELLRLPGGESISSVARKPRLSATTKDDLHQLAEQLLLLSANAHPLARPIVREYEESVAKLAAGKTSGVAARIARADTTRRRLVARMSDIDDYLNWFEATQLTTRSGMFRDYLRAAADQKAAPSHHRDPVSVYLDEVELQAED